MKEIVQDGTPVLREIAGPVPESLFGSPELFRIIKDMEEALDKELEGVALAAPQIGVPYRLFVVRKDRTLPIQKSATKNPPPVPSTPEVEVFVNPEIVRTSRKRAKMDEGCLSVRGIYGTTSRHERVTIRARRPDGSRVERGAGGLMAQIFEHEIDHLNGILFTDHAKNLVRISHAQERFAYFGTPSVASETLAALVERGFAPAVVVTSPDAPKGRGLALAPSETKELALSLGIPVLTPEKLDAAAIASIAAYECDAAVVVAYGKIFPEALISAFPKGVINVHYSLLPKYRGATPLEAALLAGDSVTGVTLQKMVKELDAGDVIAQEETPIAPEETARELRPRLISMGAALLVETLPAYLRGEIVPVPQDASRASRAGKLKKEDGLLSLDAPAEANWNKYRAYADTIGTYFFENGKRMKITAASYKNGKFTIERVIPEGKREMAYKPA
ncbi:MAG: methionyl-tRNA formyltransferase [Patescibacteria group bacterium]|nr:methionyl-tRNA formyltransferase [Patescibacteria group bacterium]